MSGFHDYEMEFTGGIDTLVVRRRCANVWGNKRFFAVALERWIRSSELTCKLTS